MIYKKDYTTVMSELLPEGKMGRFAIKKTVISKGTRIRMYCPAGFFYHDKFRSNFPTVRLIEEPGNTWMSDTPMEQEALRIPTVVAYGDVLVLGLGIGLFPVLLKMYNKRVKKVLIIEKELEVVRLVYPHIMSSRTDIRVCDAEKYLQACKDKFDFIYVDVWGSITAPLREANKWTELASHCLTERGEVRCWLQELYDKVRVNLERGPAGPTSQAGFHPPCLVCSKIIRNDYAGLCVDCADNLELSEAFIEEV